MALIQVITYNEYLPVLLGTTFPAYSGYSATTNPSLDTFFSAVAYRFGHSTINSVFQRVAENGAASRLGHLMLRDSYYNPSYLLQESIAGLLRGMAAQVGRQPHPCTPVFRRRGCEGSSAHGLCLLCVVCCVFVRT